MPVIQRLKQPRTSHLPWSPGATSDDKFIQTLEGFKGKNIQVSLKMDGETTSGYSDGFTHARSLDGGIKDEGQAWFRNYWKKHAHKFHDFVHSKGESLYWEHSLQYTEATHCFQAFALWLHNDHAWTLMDTELTKYRCEQAGIHQVPVIYTGKFDQKMLERFHETLDLSTVEGYVIRVCHPVELRNFQTHVAKFVREDHVQTDEHWRSNMKRNQLPKECFV